MARLYGTAAAKGMQASLNEAQGRLQIAMDAYPPAYRQPRSPIYPGAAGNAYGKES